MENWYLAFNFFTSNFNDQLFDEKIMIIIFSLQEKSVIWYLAFVTACQVIFVLEILSLQKSTDKPIKTDFMIS